MIRCLANDSWRPAVSGFCAAIIGLVKGGNGNRNVALASRIVPVLAKYIKQTVQVQLKISRQSYKQSIK